MHSFLGGHEVRPLMEDAAGQGDQGVAGQCRVSKYPAPRKRKEVRTTSIRCTDLRGADEAGGHYSVSGTGISLGLSPRIFREVTCELPCLDSGPIDEQRNNENNLPRKVDRIERPRSSTVLEAHPPRLLSLNLKNPVVSVTRTAAITCT